MADQDQKTGAEGVVWNLADLFAGPDDPRIEAAMAEMERRAANLEAASKGRLGAAGPADLAAALREYEAIQAGITPPLSFAQLLISGDSLNPAHGALLQRLTERQSEIQKRLLFVDLEIIAIPDARLR